ncbi:PhzF family phenazine biosynthesis protein [Roseiconus lacunae]|uniref:PhzF family phenazine biosynthesis protein n=1 Tax=Roseiconus lacunae TaxID=2605694 RepID=UPI0011F0CB7E|nr:PhzF family phenazine biosynthesis protein [Roseiconus lacunae]
MSSSPGVPIWQVDAFTDRPFGGNPAAVCLLEQFPSDEWLQQVAAEMNLSETAFLVRSAVHNQFHLRWFTPATEVDLCGHATLASVHLLIEQRIVTMDQPIRFQTRSGELVCFHSERGITMDFPATPPKGDVTQKLAETLLTALGLDHGRVLNSDFDLLVVVEEDSIVQSLHPNFDALEKIETRGVMVSASGGPQNIDFTSRFFAPRCGINEDPVTGSAHCCLAPFWAQRLGKNNLVGLQASARQGIVQCNVVGDRVHLSGPAITMFEGRLLSHPFE